MTDYMFGLVSNDSGKRATARVKALNSTLMPDDAQLDADKGEMIVTSDDGLEFAHHRAREIVRGATDGTDLYADPEPMGEWRPDAAV